jgi:hypothetical protein
VDAFRAGNFGFNAATLPALAANGIRFDSSYNACVLGPESGLLPGVTLTEPVEQDGVLEFPVTVFRDGTGTLRPLQITACSWAEIEAVLWKSLEAGRQSVVIVSHGFELLDASRSRLDPIAMRRFRKLCEFLGRHRDQFPCGPFSEPAGPGDRVAIMMPNVPQYPVAVAAVLRAGMVVVNVNPLYTPRELEHQLKDSGAKAIVILENFAATLASR